MINSILIVDDDLEFCREMKSTLERRGFKPSFIHDSAEAVESVRSHAPDLVLLDLSRAGEGGINVLKSLFRQNPRPVFLMLSRQATIPLTVQAMQEGADGVLQKPCDVDAILNLATRLWEKKKRRVLGMSESEFRSYNLNLLERVGIEKALKRTNGNVSKAAILLGIDRRTLQRKMKRIF